LQPRRSGDSYADAELFAPARTMSQDGHGSRPGWREPRAICFPERYRTATGAIVEPEPPWIFNGCMMKANS
jgi:hypothetical protein